jgi:hypothetical protein
MDVASQQGFATVFSQPRLFPEARTSRALVNHSGWKFGPSPSSGSLQGIQYEHLVQARQPPFRAREWVPLPTRSASTVQPIQSVGGASGRRPARPMGLPQRTHRDLAPRRCTGTPVSGAGRHGYPIRSVCPEAPEPETAGIARGPVFASALVFFGAIRQICVRQWRRTAARGGAGILQLEETSQGRCLLRAPLSSSLKRVRGVRDAFALRTSVQAGTRELTVAVFRGLRQQLVRATFRHEISPLVLSSCSRTAGEMTAVCAQTHP